MAFGASFLNLSDPGRLDAARTTDRIHVRAVFEQAIRDLGGASGAGGTIFVPRIGDGALWIDARDPLVIPPNIELRVASGVTLLPVVAHGGVRDPALAERWLEIQGGFHAPLTRVFVPVQRFTALAPDLAMRHDLGRVRFASHAMDRVHPEWWGANAGRNLGTDDDSDALDEAVRAAVHDRFELLPSGGRRWLRPLVIELLGTYRLSRPLLIAQFARSEVVTLPDGRAQIRSVGDGGIELRGSPGGAETPTFVCAEGFPTNSFMVTVHGFESVTVDEVRFDGQGRAHTGLHFYTAPSDFDPATRVPGKGYFVRRCGFRGATVTLVHVWTGSGSEPLQPSPPSVFDRREALFEGCHFAPTHGDKGDPEALRITAPSTLHVEARGCIFEGMARAMIHAYSCTLSVNNCQFDNRAMPPAGSDPFLLHLVNFVGIEGANLPGPQGGLDIFLDRSGNDVPATLSAQDCRTTSLQFLSTFIGGDASGQCNSTITSLHHKRRAGTIPASAIDWRISSTHGSRLVLIGCRFDRVATATEPAVRGYGTAAITEIGVFRGLDAGASPLVVVNSASDTGTYLQVPIR